MQWKIKIFDLIDFFVLLKSVEFVFVRNRQFVIDLAFERIYLSLFRLESNLSNRHSHYAKETCRKNQWISWQSSFTCCSTRTIEISRMWRWNIDSKCTRSWPTNIEVLLFSYKTKFEFYLSQLDICRSIRVEKCFLSSDV